MTTFHEFAILCECASRLPVKRLENTNRVEFSSGFSVLFAGTETALRGMKLDMLFIADAGWKQQDLEILAIHAARTDVICKFADSSHSRS